MKTIEKKFTDCTISRRGNTKIQWIVMHYFGSLASARECADWFCNPSNKQGSADFCVDDEHIIQINPDLVKYNTWHCGGGLQGSIRHSKYGICQNSNSIGIEMRPYNDQGSVTQAQNAGWYFHKETVKNTAELVRFLMEQYDIDVNHVIMHADVTGKYCPAPWLDRPDEWDKFLDMLIESGNDNCTENKKLYIDEDGSFGPETVKRSQQYLGVTVDGIVSNQPICNKKYLYSAYDGCWEFKASNYDSGSNMVRKLQQLIGAKQDGWLGHDSVLKLQSFLGTNEDASMGPDTVKKWQKYLNTHE